MGLWIDFPKWCILSLATKPTILLKWLNVILRNPKNCIGFQRLLSQIRIPSSWVIICTIFGICSEHNSMLVILLQTRLLIFCILVKKNFKDWDTKLAHARFSYNETPSYSSTHSPIKVVYDVNPFIWLIVLCFFK